MCIRDRLNHDDTLSFMIHEAAEEMNFTPKNTKDGSYGMITVYKEPPPEEEVTVAEEQVEHTREEFVPLNENASKRAKMTDGRAVTSQLEGVEVENDGSMAVGLKKRDRRSIEEIERDMKADKAQGTGMYSDKANPE
eukprot:TRINITY_DN38758_c0_g1_i2.p1 TRINITY_DN38758_c0_g1~~TRINITY_DN38758_c0_g1_i2.p1  ORF type:complete len:137 (+),score=41.64 TRINITY_DN38758_c0_g1_i2:129-539(+)